MPNYLHRTTKVYRRSFSTADLTEPVANYVVNSAEAETLWQAGVQSRYWKITGDLVEEMSQAEKDVVDSNRLDASRDSAANGLDDVENILRAFALTVLDEINTLRAQHSLADRTIAQLKTAIRTKLGS